MRKLASIRTINEISEIPTADTLVAVRVDGWTCVAKRDLFRVGDRVVYFEIDSILPEQILKIANLWCEESKKGKLNAPNGSRVKTTTIRGQVSQGLVLPLTGLVDPNLEIGADVTDILGVSKYEPEIKFKNSDVIGDFPSFIPKTDQERIENLQTLPSGDLYEISEKLDGTSATFFYHENQFGACSRNLQKKIENGTSWHYIINELKLVEKLKDRSLAIQGELIGPGIQSNKYKLKKPTLKIFDVFDINAQKYLRPAERCDLLVELGLIDHHVPILAIAPISVQSSDELAWLSSFADGISSVGPVEREGLVFKPFESKRQCFKVISKKWLLKHE